MTSRYPENDALDAGGGPRPSPKQQATSVGIAIVVAGLGFVFGDGFVLLA